MTKEELEEYYEDIQFNELTFKCQVGVCLAIYSAISILILAIIMIIMLMCTTGFVVLWLTSVALSVWFVYKIKLEVNRNETR